MIGKRVTNYSYCFFVVLNFQFFCNVAEAVARRCSVRKGVLKNFAKFTGKHLCHSLFFNKVAGSRPYKRGFFSSFKKRGPFCWFENESSKKKHFPLLRQKLTQILP